MRIITGEYRGRHFDVPRSFKARPTTDFAKENIFNVLNGCLDFEGATALDLFSGTGSIALELASRGCRHVVSVELDRDHHRFIQSCIVKLQTDRCIAVRGDAFRFVKSCREQFDLIFADPPYALPTLATLPDVIMGSTLLRPEGIFVLEHGKDHDFTAHPRFFNHRQYGSVNFTLFR